jgi:DNA-binding PadR family transcriptional regulator
MFHHLRHAIRERRFAHGGFFGRHGHHGRHGHDRNAGGGRERLLGHGDLRLLALTLIAESPRHGYELIKAIEEQTGGAYSPSPGAIYPTLTLLEDEGLAQVAAESGKKLYTLTEAGRGYVEANAAAIAAVRAKLVQPEAGSVGNAFARIMVARHSLRHALKARIRGGEVSQAQLETIAKILEDAILAIERA